MYSAQKKYIFIAALFMSFLTGGALLGMEVKTTNSAVFKELPLELNRPIISTWLETILGYNYTTRTLQTPYRFLPASLIPTCHPDLVLIAMYRGVLLYNIQTNQIEKEFKTEQPTQQIAINADKTKVAVPQGKEIVLWDLSTEEKTVVFKADELLYSVALSPDGKHILAGSSKNIYLCDITKNLVKKFKVREDSFIASIAFNRKSNKILITFETKQIVICNLQENKLTICKEYSSIDCALFSPDGHSIIAAGKEGISIFDAHTGNVRLTNSDIGSISSLACSPDGNTLIAGSAEGHKIYVIDLKTVKLLTTLENFEGNILGMCFTSDGNNIISASANKTFCLHSRLKEEHNAWIDTRKEAALELFFQLLGKKEQGELSISMAPATDSYEQLSFSMAPTTNYYQQLQSIPKDKAFLIFAILAMILGYNL